MKTANRMFGLTRYARIIMCTNFRFASWYESSCCIRSGQSGLDDNDWTHLHVHDVDDGGEAGKGDIKLVELEV